MKKMLRCPVCNWQYRPLWAVHLQAVPPHGPGDVPLCPGTGETPAKVEPPLTDDPIVLDGEAQTFLQTGRLPDGN